VCLNQEIRGAGTPDAKHSSRTSADISTLISSEKFAIFGGTVTLFKKSQKYNTYYFENAFFHTLKSCASFKDYVNLNSNINDNDDKSTCK